MDRFEERLARVGVDVEAARARAQAATTFRQGVEDVRGHGVHGGVEVVVDSGGTLVDVVLGAGLEELSRSVLGAYGQARKDAGRAVVSLARDAFGDEDSSISRLEETYGVSRDDETEAKQPRRTDVFRPGGWR